MDRPGKFEHSRWLGDKRTQVVYDVDNLTDELLQRCIPTHAGNSPGN